jgi:DNA-directed RNA polymerase subunit M/transcription elongation factor TFIIS
MLQADAEGIRVPERMGTALRVRLRACLGRALAEGTCVPPADIPTLAARLEMCAFAHARGKPEGAMATVSRVVFNLRTNGVHILSKNPLSRVCRLTHQRMGAESAHALRDTRVENQVAQLLEDAAAAAEASLNRAAQKTSAAAIRCPRCKTQDGIVRTTAQTRAADEGMGTRCMCTQCAHRWRLS